MQLMQGDCLQLMSKLPDKSVDAIVTDPPYEYLKHKLDRPFDEQAAFSEWNRIVKDDGFLVFFGRGASFHRWNYLLNEMGWQFKEEIVWDKIRTSSPFTPILRCHENVSILSKKSNVKKSFVDYVEKNKNNVDKMTRDISRLANVFGNSKEFNSLVTFLKSKHIIYDDFYKKGVTASGTPTSKPVVSIAKGIIKGQREQDVIRISSQNNKFHPTQKPVRLMERLLFCTTDKGQTILDPFMGSGSTGVACVNTNRDFIGMELDEEYFNIAENRIQEAQSEIRLDV